MLYVLVLAGRSLKVRMKEDLLFAVGKTKQTMTKMLIFMFWMTIYNHRKLVQLYMTWQMANHVNGVWLKNDFQIQDDKIWEKHELEQLPEVRAKINTLGGKYVWKRQT